VTGRKLTQNCMMFSTLTPVYFYIGIFLRRRRIVHFITPPHTVILLAAASFSVIQIET